MKTLSQIFLVTIISVALATGCKQKPKANPSQAHTTANESAAYPESGFQPGKGAANQAAKTESSPGTIRYLDDKNGFRDVTFGQTDSEISNLVLKRSDDVRQLKTYTRSGDNLTLNSVPLSTIEYTFLKGQLFQIAAKWSVDEKKAVLKNSSTTSLAPFCASLYGPAKRHTNKKEAAEYIWRGKRVELIVNEIHLPGVQDTIRGGWALAPSTKGQMIIEDIDLRKALGAEMASSNGEKKDGL